MRWLMKILNFYLEEQLLTNCCTKIFGLPSNGIKDETISNKELVKELHRPFIRKFHKRKVQSPSIENIWGADLADMQFNKQSKFKYLFFIISY